MPEHSPIAFVRAPGRGWRRPPALILGAAVIIPSVSGHWHVAARETKPFADAYAKSTFAELPPHSVLFITGAELTDPLIYRQVVYHERRDVVPIALDGLRVPWYREQVTRELGRPLPPTASTLPLTAADVIKSVAATRPTYLDPQTVAYLDGHLGYRPVGLLNVPGPGSSYNPPASVAGVEQRVLAAEKAAQMPDPYWNVWPNDFLKSSTYSNAELEVARAYYLQHDLTSMKRALQNVLSIEPTNPSALKDISLLSGSG